MIPFSNTLSNLIGFLYPAYASYKALKKEPNGREKQWLTYWTVYALLRVFEMITYPNVWSLYYYDLRLLLVIWLQFPKYGGAEYIFKRFVQPLFDKYEDKIDEHITNVRDNALIIVREKASLISDHALQIWQNEDFQKTVQTGVFKLFSFTNSLMSSKSESIESVTSLVSESQTVVNRVTDEKFEEVREEPTIYRRTSSHVQTVERVLQPVSANNQNINARVQHSPKTKASKVE